MCQSFGRFRVSILYCFLLQAVLGTLFALNVWFIMDPSQGVGDFFTLLDVSGEEDERWCLGCG